MGMSENWVSYSYESNSTENLRFCFKDGIEKKTEQTPKNKLENQNLRKKTWENPGVNCVFFISCSCSFFLVILPVFSCVFGDSVFVKINFLWSRCWLILLLPSMIHPVISQVSPRSIPDRSSRDVVSWLSLESMGQQIGTLVNIIF